MSHVAVPTSAEVLDLLERDYGISGGLIYLLDVVPLIEMVWADGTNQPAEIRLVYKFALDRLAQLSSYAEGQQALSIDETNAFLDRFLSSPPPAGLLRELRQLCLHGSADRVEDPVDRAIRCQTILEYCMDIAAAAVTRYPYGDRERVTREEKGLLLELMGALNISPDLPPC